MRSALLVLILALGGCGGGPADHAEHGHADSAEHDGHHAAAGHADEVHRHDAHGGAGQGKLLRIDPEMMRDLRVTTSPVESRPSGDGVTALGEIGVNEERYAEVGPAITARIGALLVGVGDVVTPGQALASLESVELGKARAELATAEANVALARQTLVRKRGLAAERIVPRREVEEAEAATAAAEAQLRAAASAVKAVGVGEAEGGAFQLLAPIAGTVIEREGVRGQMVEPTRPLFRIAELSELWLTVHAFERDAVRVAPGARARVTLAATPGRSFAGTVSLVGRRVDAASRTMPIRIDLPNVGEVLRPGMSASAWLPIGDDQTLVLAVPAAALQRVRDAWTVFLPRGGGVFEAREVGRGRDLGGEVEIVQGLAPGETVVVEGAFLLKAETEKASGEGEHHDH